jgi:hypothetical protein
MSPARRMRGLMMDVRRGAMLAFLAAVLLLAVSAAVAVADPVNEIDVISNTTAAPGSTHVYYVNVLNVGDQPNADADADGVADDPRVLTVTLPPGVTATGASGFRWDCSATDFSTSPSVVSCTNTSVLIPTKKRSTHLNVTTSVDPNAVTGPATATFDMTGGNAVPVSTVDETSITSQTPPFGIDSFDGQVASDAAGDVLTQAGGHPYSISTQIFFNTFTNPVELTGDTWPVAQPKDLLVDLPPGFVGSATATGESLCTLAQLSNASGLEALPLCPPGSQVGLATIFTANGLLLDDTIPVFNMVAPPNAPARFGFDASGSVVTLDASLRSGGDYGLTVGVHDIPEALALAGTRLTFWGVPADPSHDGLRACPGQLSPGTGGPTCTTEVPRRAFLRNPTSCTAPGVGLTTSLRADSWADPGDFASASFVSHLAPNLPFPHGAEQGTTGCADVPFEPTFSAGPSPSGAAGAPSGFAFDLNVPQNDDPDQIATGDLKKAVVTLPVGLRVSPSSANGLGACSPAQINLNSAADSACPGSSKLGTVTIDTPLLKDPLTGSVYLATPHDNPSGSLIALYIVVRGPGLVVKLPGSVAADPVTGQLKATFDNNPQLPFSHLHLEFLGGPRAALVDPPQCGSYPTDAVLDSWSGATVTSDSSFDVSKDGNGTPCGPARFAPTLSAGVDSVKAGQHTSFTLRLARDDADQEFKALTVTTPKGLLAKVAGVPLCPAANAAAGTCSEASRVGSVLTGAGAGTDPFYLPGRVYLTGPYKGGPYGLSIVVPAVAGPFDLGTVVVRTAIQVDRHTAQLHVISDPLPTILQGIPLQIRDVRVTIDRSRFMLNPTSCVEKHVTSQVSSTGGKTANPSDRFQVGGCSKLRLAPKLTLTVGSKGHTHLHASAPLTAKLTQTPGQSNLASVRVSLPATINALLSVVNNACTRAAFDAGRCGAKARTGSAVAVTPLLSKPLRGSVYFVKTAKKGALPDLIVALRGQVNVDLVGKVTIPGGIRLSTTFNTIPDVPIKSFALRLVAGKNGVVGAAANLCSASAKQAKANVSFRGQNGAVINRSQSLQVRGCKKGAHG